MSSNSSDDLRAYFEAASSLWQHYLEAGPGNLAPNRHESLVDLWNRLPLDMRSGGQAELAESLQTVHRLAARCVERPEGLCFVTGEAGLIPHRELHLQFAAALDRIRDACQFPED